MKPVINLLGYKFYLNEFFIFFLCYFIMEAIFSWLLIQNAPLIDKYQQILSIGIFGFTFLAFKKLERFEQAILAIFTFFVIKLVIESLIHFNTLFEHFAIFTVLFPVVYVIFIKQLFIRLNLDILEFIVKLYLIGYFLFMLLFGRGFGFSLEHYGMEGYLGPFSGDSRIIHAKSIFMMSLPFLWYLNKYLITRSRKSLVWLTTCFIIILLHQHRSVWISLIVATGFYFLFQLRFKKQLKYPIWKFGLASATIFTLALFALTAVKPEMVSFFGDRFSEILEPNKEGTTGHFRALQREVYFSLYIEKPILGWAFEGYELPNPIVDWWPAKTGQHFHEGYMEVLFYHGVLGLLLKYSFLLLILVRSLQKKLSPSATVLSAFCLSGLVFSMAYVPPLIFWGHVGLCLYYLHSGSKMLHKNSNNLL